MLVSKEAVYAELVEAAYARLMQIHSSEGIGSIQTTQGSLIEHNREHDQDEALTQPPTITPTPSPATLLVQAKMLQCK